MPTRIRHHLVPTLLVLGCSEYALQDKEDVTAGFDTALDSADPGDATEPNIAVNPASITAKEVCGTSTHDVTVTNIGDGPLRIRSASITGDGWLLDGPALPLRINAGGSALFTATGSQGEANLTFRSTDPDQPEISVPLKATADQPPSIRIEAPMSGEVLAVDADAPLRAVVDDAEDAAETLDITWVSSEDGTLITGPAATDGTLEATWSAAGRSAATHTLTLRATDSCGQTTTEVVDICQQALSTYDELDLTDWHFEGVSYWDTSNDWLELTSPVSYSVGSAFETGHIVNGGAVEIEFMFYIGGGSGADGISLTALDTDRYDGNFLGGTGCGIGFGGGLPCTPGPALPGWSIEVDTHYNNDPEGLEPTTSDHIAFYFDGNLASIQAWAALPPLEDTGWHSMRVVVEEPHLLVQIDGLDVIDTELAGLFDFNAWLGFTAGTGGYDNYHLVDSLQVTEAACEE